MLQNWLLPFSANASVKLLEPIREILKHVHTHMSMSHVPWEEVRKGANVPIKTVIPCHVYACRAFSTPSFTSNSSSSFCVNWNGWERHQLLLPWYKVPMSYKKPAGSRTIILKPLFFTSRRSVTSLDFRCWRIAARVLTEQELVLIEMSMNGDHPDSCQNPQPMKNVVVPALFGNFEYCSNTANRWQGSQLFQCSCCKDNAHVRTKLLKQRFLSFGGIYLWKKNSELIGKWYW